MKIRNIVIAFSAPLLFVGCSTVESLKPVIEAPKTFIEAHKEKPQPPKIVWPNGAKAAIALTYDDGLNSHLDVAVPALEKAGLKATFYIALSRYSWRSRTSEWKQIAANGYELGNKSISEPCSAGKPDRNWVKNDLDHYTVEQIETELERANQILSSVDGKTSRTYAYPCGESKTSDGSYYNAIKPLFTGARAVYDIPYRKDDRYNIEAFYKDNATGDEMIAYIESVVAKGDVGSLQFFGVGGDYMSVSKEAHQQVVDYLAAHKDEIWVDTLENITSYMASVE